MKSSRETLQNLPYFWNKKNNFFHFSFERLWIWGLGPGRGLCLGIQCNKSLAARNKKNCLGFLIPKNMTNFEAFLSSGAFCRAQTLKLLRVYTIVYLSRLLLEHGKICKVKVELGFDFFPLDPSSGSVRMEKIILALSDRSIIIILCSE